MAYPVSPYQKTGGLVFFARMIDKIHLHARGSLPADYEAFLHKGFNAWMCEYLEVDYADLARAVIEGKLDAEAALEWCYARRGRALNATQIKAWNVYARLFGQQGEAAAALARSAASASLGGRGIETFFELFATEEGHPKPRA
ncbi:MAG: DUF5069 domain-containing protein [Verrucomicrobiota bacterium JB022]|nr:DUF5069 domain-containing protein [Verrucomicrobiota bacterium JB022]